MKRVIAAISALFMAIVTVGCSGLAVIKPMTAAEYSDELNRAHLEYVGESRRMVQSIEDNDPDAARDAENGCIKMLDVMIGLPAPAEVASAESAFEAALQEEKEYIAHCREFVELKAAGNEAERLAEVAAEIKDYLERSPMTFAMNDMIVAVNKLK